MTINPTFGLPDPGVDFVTVTPTSQKGASPATFTAKLTPVWYRALIRLAQLTAERAVVPVALGASPFTFTATTIGDLLVRGGTVSANTLSRGNDSVSCPAEGFIPMAANDRVTITYSVLPTVTFVPRARA